MGGSLVCESSPVQRLISQNSGKDKPPSIDAIKGQNEHGRARDAASVASEHGRTCPNPFAEVENETDEFLDKQ